MSSHPPLCLSALPPSPHLLQTELGAIHKILHLPPQTISYNLAINLASLSGFSIRSACTAMNASMSRFALKSFPQAKEMNENLIEATLEHVPLCFLGSQRGFPITPGWNSHAYVSNLAYAVRHDNDLGTDVPDFAAFIRKNQCKIERNCSIQEIAMQKQVYNILIDKIPSGWNSLILRRLSDFGVESELIHNSFEFFRVKLKRIQPHLRMFLSKL